MRLATAALALVAPWATLAAQGKLVDAPAYTTEVVILRARPDSRARFVARLEAETAVHVVGCENDWCQVSVDRRAGYLPRQSLRAEAERPVLPAERVSADTLMVFLNPGEAPQIFLESAVEVRPELESGPPLEYPPLMRLAGVQGRVLVQAVLDTFGRAEPRSIRILQSPDSGLHQSARDFLLHAQFRPARLKGRAVRVLINLPIDYKIRARSEP